MVDQIKSNSGIKGTKAEQLTADLGSLPPLAPKAMIVLKWLKWLARVFAVCILVQVFLIGLALFVDTAYLEGHKSFVHFFSILPLVMIVLSFIARLPVTFRMQSIRLLGLIIAEYPTAILASKIGFLSALHPVIALVLFWYAMSLAKQAAAHTRTKSL
jgi:hypothetical protein